MTKKIKKKTLASDTIHCFLSSPTQKQSLNEPDKFKNSSWFMSNFCCIPHCVFCAQNKNKYMWLSFSFVWSGVEARSQNSDSISRDVNHHQQCNRLKVFKGAVSRIFLKGWFGVKIKVFLRWWAAQNKTFFKMAHAQRYRLIFKTWGVRVGDLNHLKALQKITPLTFFAVSTLQRKYPFFFLWCWHRNDNLISLSSRRLHRKERERI